MKGKTLDGIKLNKILRVVEDLTGIEIRPGTNHPHILKYAGLQPCPVAESTHAERMLVPWLKKATGHEKTRIYQALRKGYW